VEKEYRFFYRHYRFPRHSMLWPNTGNCVTPSFTGRHGVAYRYMRGVTAWQPKNNGGYTVCDLCNEDGDVLVVRIAECSPKDQFCYRTGRDIARGRALKALAEFELAELEQAVKE